ncbi:zinc dependent phospholipase C family protein [Oryzomonas sagensis]|uniref:Zinc dependent phospholipase C family protein n=1 Tax=Oryzomonas sagensis TaxID=2603857 RepID=A0ABQ6TMQ4_9BACT|nr:zinc dependent phospholipase C family protein [Oryzomonas sagensis]KAB0669744.1 zinc dependent phospholipase C family protein [Oryzomonas sagensis]
MPKELTHWLLAERSLAGLEDTSRLSVLIRENRALYLAGAVLPDTLLHLIGGPHGPTARGLAHRFHDAEGNSYAPLIRAEESCGAKGFPAGLFACLLGVLSHMQADIVFHPFVYARGGTRDIGRHYRVETALDCHFSRQGTHLPARRLAALMTPAVRVELVTASALLFDPEGQLPHQALERALTLHCRIQAMYGSTFWKLVARLLACLPLPLFKQARHLFYPLIRSGNDPVQLLGNWRHPVTGEEKAETPDDLAQEVVRRTVALFERIDAEGGLKGVLGASPGENLLTGRYGVGRQEMERPQP